MKHINNSRRAQSSTEFVILLSFMMIVLMSFFIIVQDKIVEANEEKTAKASTEVMDIIVAEIRLAESVSDNYYREFYLPLDVNGREYEASIMRGVASTSEVVLKYDDKEKVYFLEEFVNSQSTLGKGINNITKNKGIITIHKMT